MRQLTEQHRHQLGPAIESLGPVLRLMFGHERGKFAAREMLKQLIEETGHLYH